LAVLLIGLTLALTPAAAFRPYRLPLAVLGALGASIAIQLVPLPPSLWAGLPLSGVYRDALSGTGLDGIWRPLSIAPDLTLNSLLALLPPLAVLLALAAWPQRYRERLLTWVLAAIALSAILGLAQFVGGENSRLYLWADRSEAVADGVFANRNHQAVFLACGLALLGHWISAGWNHLETNQQKTVGRKTDSRSRRSAGHGLNGVGGRLAVGAGLAALFLMTVMATGSRTGTALSIVAATYGYWCVIRSPVIADGQVSRPLRLALRWGWLIVPLLLVVMVISSRAVTFERLTATDATTDQRARSLPVMLDMLGRLFPHGSGYGTFDPLFQTFEPDHLLHYGYFNHAHNDLLELLLLGGLPALLVMLFAIVWFAMTTRCLLAASLSTSPGKSVRLGRSAAVAVLLVVVASIVDYPARTPLIACFLMILAIWMTDGARASRSSDDRD
jgi:O-antigen ligase